VEKYHRVEEIGWVQEEPRNRGAWTFMEPRLRQMFPDTLLGYYGRDESASPAVGSVKMHQVEEKELVAAALGVRPQAVPVAKGTPATATTQTAASQ
jgi:2-oxoglutarate dehydrogenase E1 component